MCYATEREVRYILLNLRGKFDVHRKEFDSKHYVEATLPLRRPGSIIEILIGPRAPDGTAEKLREFLRRHGYPAIPIRPSSAVLERAEFKM
jgi:hypothetical protein